jgi:hypothetical protein
VTPVRRVYEIIHDKKAGKARRFGGLFRFIKTGEYLLQEVGKLFLTYACFSGFFTKMTNYL